MLRREFTAGSGVRGLGGGFRVMWGWFLSDGDGKGDVVGVCLFIL